MIWVSVASTSLSYFSTSVLRIRNKIKPDFMLIFKKWFNNMNYHLLIFVFSRMPWILTICLSRCILYVMFCLSILNGVKQIIFQMFCKWNENVPTWNNIVQRHLFWILNWNHNCHNEFVLSSTQSFSIDIFIKYYRNEMRIKNTMKMKEMYLNHKLHQNMKKIKWNYVYLK